MEKIKVLIGSNSTLFSRTLSRMISAENCEIVLTRDENEVIESLLKKEIDLCFLRDSVSNSLEICEQFSNDPIPIIIFSPQKSVENQALEKGASGFLKVPCQSKEVLALVKQWTQLTQLPSSEPSLPQETELPPPLQEVEPTPAKRDFGVNTSDMDLEETTSTEVAAPGELPRILLIDDSKLIHTAAGDILKDNDFQLIHAYDGVEGLQKANALTPDLILSDVNMPRMDGFETCKRLKISEKTKEIPVIFLTANTETEDIIKGFELGAVDYVAKPFNSMELLARVHTHLELYQTLDNLTRAHEELKTTQKQRLSS